MGTVDGLLERADLLACEFRTQLRDPVLDSFDGGLKLPNTFPVACE